MRRRLVGVEIEGERLDFNATRWPVLAAGEPVGEVTSAIWSPRLRKNIGYAWLPVERSAAGNRLTVETGGGAREATVVAMPFVDPQKRIPVS